MSEHLPFNKYSSIENSYQTPYINKVKLTVHPDVLWSVSEKVHGANCCMITDGNIVEFAKRSGIVGDGGGFFNYELVLAEHQQKILEAFNYIKNNLSYTGIKVIQFYGELFGGSYPHPDVKRNSMYTAVQKGLYYAPFESFYGFDIAIITENDRFWLSPDIMEEVYSNNKILCAESLYVGTLDECLNYNNMFQTNIPKWLGLPPIEDNICEGVVIKPMIPQFLPNGERILIKNKNERFAEKKHEKVHKEKVDLPEEIQNAVNTILEYTTGNRLANVISHEGEFDMPKDFGKLIKLYTEDILNDFIKENLLMWNGLSKSNQRIITKAMNSQASQNIKNYYKIYG